MPVKKQKPKGKHKSGASFGGAKSIQARETQHGSAPQRQRARQHPEDVKKQVPTSANARGYLAKQKSRGSSRKRSEGLQAQHVKPSKSAKHRRNTGREGRGVWDALSASGFSWARKGLAAPGSAVLRCAGPTRFDAGRQVPARLDRARLGCGEALARPWPGSGLDLVILARAADRLCSATDPQARLCTGPGSDRQCFL